MPTIISVTSGKGGVGKTSMAVNMSLRLQDAYGPTLLIDSDLLMANCHVLLNSQPNLDLIDVLEGRYDWPEAVHTLENGLSFLAGRTAANHLVETNINRLTNLLTVLKSDAHGFDYIVVDTPAGSGVGVLNTLSVSDHTLIVLLGQATSFIDAYALIKSAYFERKLSNFAAIVNIAKSAKQANLIFNNFNRTVTSFLPVDISYKGHVTWMQDIDASSTHGGTVSGAASKARIADKMDTILKSLLVTAPVFGINDSIISQVSSL
jgi:flagellar biosynthesis protein FlhG